MSNNIGNAKKNTIKSNIDNTTIKTSTNRRSKVSPSLENYLEEIYSLGVDSTPVRITDVALELGVSKASVTKAVGVLKNAGFLNQERYGTIELTEEGLNKAQDVYRRHATLKRFLVDILGVDEKTAEDDACDMEHVISEVTAQKWIEYVEKTLSSNNE